jgi:hypothetical protein
VNGVRIRRGSAATERFSATFKDLLCKCTNRSLVEGACSLGHDAALTVDALERDHELGVTEDRIFALCVLKMSCRALFSSLKRGTTLYQMNRLSRSSSG